MFNLISDKDDKHVPDFPLTGNMRHIGIVDGKGRVIATVWNHHHFTECDLMANNIVLYLNNAMKTPLNNL